MTSSEIERQIEQLRPIRFYNETQQIAHAQMLALWEIALQLAKSREPMWTKAEERLDG